MYPGIFTDIAGSIYSTLDRKNMNIRYWGFRDDRGWTWSANKMPIGGDTNVLLWKNLRFDFVQICSGKIKMCVGEKLIKGNKNVFQIYIYIYDTIKHRIRYFYFFFFLRFRTYRSTSVKTASSQLTFLISRCRA